MPCTVPGTFLATVAPTWRSAPTCAGDAPDNTGDFNRAVLLSSLLRSTPSICILSGTPLAPSVRGYSIPLVLNLASRMRVWLRYAPAGLHGVRMSPGVGGIILASGMSTRFGASNKLLAHVHGVPVVQSTAQAYVDAGLDPLVVVVGH